MVKSLVYSSSNGGDIRSTVAGDYDSVCCGVSFSDVSETSDGKTVWRTPGTFSNYWMNVNTNNQTGAATIMLRKNGANSAITLSISAGATGEFEDTTHTVSVAAGDWFAMQQLSGSAANLKCLMWSLQFTPTTTTDCVSKLGTCHGGNTTTTASNTAYLGHGTDNFPNATEANRQLSIPVAVTAKNLHVNTAANRATGTTYTFRDNATSKTMTLNATGAAGVFEDTSHTDAVAADDLTDIVQITSTGTDTVDPRVNTVDYVSTNGDSLLYAYASANNGVQVFAINSTGYVMIGSMQQGQTTEANQQLKTRLVTATDGTCIVKLLRVSVSANATTVASTVDFRKNAASGTQTISIAGGATGIFTDTTHTDSLTASTDKINFRVVNADATTAHTLTLRYIVAVLNIVPPVTTLPATVFVEWEEA